jgi:IS5 family transposase
VNLHGKKVTKAKEGIVGTTVQEKNITYPTDVKLYKKIIERVNKEAKKLGIKLRQSYVRVVKKLMYAQRYLSIAKRSKKAKKAINKLCTIASRQVRDFSRQIETKGKGGIYADLVGRMQAILSQDKGSKNKVYSLHEPGVSCIAKGKTGKRYEFGCKVSLASLPGSGVIVGVETYQGSPHDSTTLGGVMKQV